jgi:methylated-DNA-[protein]-cysteine S-methyltransferase
MSPIDERQLKSILGATPEDSEAAARRLAERADREGLAEVAYAAVDTPLGTGMVAGTSRGVLRVMLPNDSPERVLEQISTLITPRVLELPARLDRERRELEEYFSGRRELFDLDLDWRLTPPGFYRKVLRTAARRLPFGATASYGQVAAWAGSPRAYRAAGTALATNPIPIVVPCHRVLRAGGQLGGYGGGPEMKEWLLRLEGAIDGDND